MPTTVIRGFSGSFTDAESGATYPNAYFYIRQINLIPNTSCLVVCDVYATKTAFDNGRAPVSYNVQSTPVLYDSTDWNSLIDAAAASFTTQSLLYIESIY